MRQDPPAFPGACEQSAGFAEPLSSLCREAGLAAVAAELDLQVYELAPEVAEAVVRGAAALFLGGYGPYPTLTRQSAGVGKEGRQRKAPRAATKATRSSISPREERRSAIAAT
jgi:hypothetical protein